MDSIVNEYLLNLEFGELYQFENMAVVPIFSPIDDSPGYLVLKEALERKFITITEVSHGGSVPELKVANKGNSAVLILDGEELVGAKQNRILNTSILLKKNTETIIPVSCVEQHRWSYVSREFISSDSFMSSELRAIKNYSVTSSLGRTGKYNADQHAIWNGVHKLAVEANVSSPTGAMKHVFDSRKNDLDEYLKAFKYQPHQKGLLVLVNGEIAGFDAVSLESAQEKLYPKLVRSYAMDALFDRKTGSREPSLEKAEGFVNRLRSLEEKHYQSVGQGKDYRYSGYSIVGSALVFRKKLIHAAFFRAREEHTKSKMF